MYVKEKLYELNIWCIDVILNQLENTIDNCTKANAGDK